MNKHYGRFCADGETACVYLQGDPQGMMRCRCSKFKKVVKPYRSIFVIKCTECMREDKDEKVHKN